MIWFVKVNHYKDKQYVNSSTEGSWVWQKRYQQSGDQSLESSVIGMQGQARKYLRKRVVFVVFPVCDVQCGRGWEGSGGAAVI